jgi:hypothetical protein
MLIAVAMSLFHSGKEEEEAREEKELMCVWEDIIICSSLLALSNSPQLL